MAEGSEVKVLGYRQSLFVARVLMALAVKGIPCQLLHENLQNKSQLLLQSNPVYKKIPVLIHDEKPLCESLVILHYIDEAWPCNGPALFPQDPYDRAIARFWAAFIDGKLSDCLRGIMNPDEEVQKKSREEADQNMALLEHALRTTFAGKMYFGGDEVGFVDLVLGSTLSHIKAVETVRNVVVLSKEKTPLLYDWSVTFCATEAVKEHVPDVVNVTEVLRDRVLARQNPK